MTGLALKQTVESMFDVIRDRSTKEELVFVCPQPGCTDQSGHRSVNLKSGKTNCWKCNKGGDFVAWARFVLGAEISDEGVSQAAPLEQLDFRSVRDEETPLPVVADVRLPEGFTYCHNRPKNIYTQLIAEMAERKNLSIEDFFQAKVGFTRIDLKWEPYALFPVFEYGHVVYWQGRTYDDVPGQPTKRFPDRIEVLNSAKFWVYGIDELRDGRASIALVTESILNVLSMRRFFREQQITGIAPISVFKHRLSKPQVKKLLQIPSLKEICLLYDHDATRSSWEKSWQLITDRVVVSVAEMPPGPGGEKNDPNDDPQAGWDAFEQRRRSTPLDVVQRVTLMRPGPKPKLFSFMPVSGRPLDGFNL